MFKKKSRTRDNRNLEYTVYRNTILISCIPFLLVALASFAYVSVKAFHDQKRNLIDSVYKSSQLINSELDMYLIKSDVLLQNRYLPGAIQKEYAGDIEKMMELYSNLEILIAEPFGAKYRGFFTIYPFNDSLFEGSYIERYDRIQDLLESLSFSPKDESGILWLDTLQQRKYLNDSDYIKFYRYIKDFDKPIGVLEANIPFDSIKKIMDNTALSKGAALIYKDGKGQVNHGTGTDLFKQDASATMTRKYISVTETLVNSHTITAAIPYLSVLMPVVRLLLITLIGLILIVLAMLYISKYSARTALFRLKKFIDSIRFDDTLLLNQHLIPESVGGEVAVIEKRFKELISRINELYQEVTTEKIEKNKFEIELLQARINPHLLYNSLSAIKWNAQRNHDKRTVELIDNMTRYYRISLNKGNNIITISEEIDMIVHYVKINDFAYSRTYTVEFDIEDHIRKMYTFKHLLQPIVENSLLHGLNGREQGGVITISGKIVEGDILLTVTDNGAGMSEEKVNRIFNLESTSILAGYGMKNLIKRINMYYGEDYGIRIHSVPGAGTEVAIRIKAIERKEELSNIS
ncbi:sensor histidine kinase [Paenibacillus contaminans]|uniref:Histidine kinase/HSP90-like ATPase domain-containing protein n=1 Tax=Paenibacillus contaminans TaxID=450362 RepID=A0A329MGT7_9BACL|nr:histidine kinase [Paenibacillus contaminans]RAV18902.1 hypothetical protein DQG23_22360 [Paenibacillus contaminans]